MESTTTNLSELFEVGNHLNNALVQALADEALPEAVENPDTSKILISGMERLTIVIDNINHVAERDSIAVLDDTEIDQTIEFVNTIVGLMRVMIRSEKTWKRFVKDTAEKKFLGQRYVEWSDQIDTDFLIEYNNLMEV